MKVTKRTLTLTVEVLSTDVLPSMLGEVAQDVMQGTMEGSLHHDDGDCAKWEVTETKKTI